MAPATTLDGLPEADRKRIQVVSDHERSVPGIDGEVSKKEPATSTTLGLAAGHDRRSRRVHAAAGLSKGLTNVAAAGARRRLTPAPLPPNTTITLELDLTAQGGTRALYRFTFTPAARRKGTTPASGSSSSCSARRPCRPGRRCRRRAQGGRPARGPGPGRRQAEGRVAHARATSGAELDALRAAISQIPDAHLALVSGLKFARDAAASDRAVAAGDYDPKKHTVDDVRQRAFDARQTSLQRAAGPRVHGAPTRSCTRSATRSTCAPLRKATTLDKADRSGQRRRRAPRRLPRRPERYSTRSGGTENKAQGEPQGAPRRRAGSKTARRSGTKPTGRTRTVNGRSTPDGNKFREAVKKDGGKGVSRYGETDWQETYAEAYSLFITSPDTLKALRPATYAYLETTLPSRRTP